MERDERPEGDERERPVEREESHEGDEHGRPVQRDEAEEGAGSETSDDVKPERLADELDREAGAMQRRSDEMGDDVQGVRQEWRRKQQDDGVPGAEPDHERDERELAEEEGEQPGGPDPD